MGTRRRHLSPASQAGFSLIELMISMVIGLVVIGAMFAAYLGSGLSSRNTRAMSQITEDASIALSVMRSAIAATSYITPDNSDANGFIAANGGNGRADTLSGCNSGFSNIDAALGALECEADDGPDAIAVSYEADAQNSAVNAAGDPLDCLGNAVPLVGAVRPAYQRFFVNVNGDESTLSCKGPDNDNGALALVDNVVDLRVTYGVGGAIPANLHRVVRYMDAAAIRDENPALFDRVNAVRVCVTVRSPDNVLDAVTQYADCTGTSVDPPGDATDRRMYRSFTTTIVLHNRLEARL